MTKIVTVACQKGGVGKTTTVLTLAHKLALEGHSALIIDTDPQGNVATALGMAQEGGVFNWIADGRPVKEVVRKARKEDNLYILPSNKTTEVVQQLMNLLDRPIDYFVQLIKPLTNNGLEYIFFDTSPSVGGMQERALYAANLAIIPTAVDFLSADAVSQTINTMNSNAQKGWKGKALVLPTFYDETTRESKQVFEELFENYPKLLLDPIHKATILRECPSYGKTIWEIDGKCRSAIEYARVVMKIKEL